MEKNGNNEKEFRETLQVIDFLDKGDQLQDPFIRGKVEKALRGNPKSFHDHLQRHPDIMERAKTHILINSKLIEENPFWPPPHTPEGMSCRCFRATLHEGSRREHRRDLVRRALATCPRSKTRPADVG